MRRIHSSRIFEDWGGGQGVVDFTLLIAWLEIRQVCRTISRERALKKEKWIGNNVAEETNDSTNLHRKAFFLSGLFALEAVAEASLRSSSNIALEALQTEWLANKVLMSFRRRRL